MFMSLKILATQLIVHLLTKDTVVTPMPKSCIIEALYRLPKKVSYFSRSGFA